MSLHKTASTYNITKTYIHLVTNSWDPPGGNVSGLHKMGLHTVEAAGAWLGWWLSVTNPHVPVSLLPKCWSWHKIKPKSVNPHAYSWSVKLLACDVVTMSISSRSLLLLFACNPVVQSSTYKIRIKGPVRVSPPRNRYRSVFVAAFFVLAPCQASSTVPDSTVPLLMAKGFW
jgi:hypothetical protein